jgi:hypothetical protein
MLCLWVCGVRKWNGERLFFWVCCYWVQLLHYGCFLHILTAAFFGDLEAEQFSSFLECFCCWNCTVAAGLGVVLGSFGLFP